ncbi:MAG: tetratricopeptide repeat protein [Cyclobacteriaceae bacterium]
MRNSPLLFLLILFSLNSTAQRKQFIDSLKQDLIQVTDDSLRFRLLDELAWTYKQINADSALMYGQQGLEISQNLEIELKAIILATISVTKRENGIGDNGIKEILEAIEINKQLDHQGRLASNYNNLGSAYESIGQYDKAVDFLTQSLQIKTEQGNMGSAASTMSNLSLVYEQIGNLDKAIEYLEKALEIVGPESRRARGMYHNMGLMLMRKGNYPESRSYFFKALEGVDKNENERSYSSGYGNIGITYLREGQLDSALVYTLESLQLKQKIGQRAQLSHPALTLAEIYLDKGQFSNARKYASLADEVVKENPSLEREAEVMKILARIEMKAGNFELANQHLLTYFDLDDSLKSKAVLDAAEEAEARFQNQLKEQENEFLRNDGENKEQIIRNQNIIIGGAIIILILLISIALLLRKQLRERKNLMKEIERQAEKLRELDKAKTRFFANISHDLRSPLTLILGALDTINGRDADILDQESRELLDVGYKNGKRLLYLADEIMDLTRLEEGKVQLDFQVVKIVPYLRLLTKMFSSAADIKLIELKFSSKLDEETIIGLDPHQFEKIIYNLLSNAIKFTPEEGSVKIMIEKASGSEALKIIISDSGSGIPEESIHHVFDRYYQAGSEEFKSQAGVGIGLALVKELVELHSGSIHVESSEEGTRFIITLPFSEVDAKSGAIIPDRSLDVVVRNSLWVDLQEERDKKIQVSTLTNSDENAKTVLIVEDHKELRSYLRSILSPEYRVCLAANGASALDLLRVEHIDLIITDLMMPYMDGFEFIEHLKNDKELKKLPVLVVSARTDKTEKLELLARGAEEVISKPFDKEELFLRIKNILEKEWDNSTKLKNLYGETAEEFEKNIMARLERLIIKRVDDPHLSVLDLADEMAASERKVYRMIKKISGLTPYELIKEVRWQYLENYLKNNKIRTASEAALLIGMSNPTFFSEQYTRRFGHPLAEVLEEV